MKGCLLNIPQYTYRIHLFLNTVFKIMIVLNINRIEGLCIDSVVGYNTSF